MSNGCFRLHGNRRDELLEAVHTSTGTFVYDALVRYREFLESGSSAYAEWFAATLPSLELTTEVCLSAPRHLVDINYEAREIRVSKQVMRIPDLGLHRAALDDIAQHGYRIYVVRSGSWEKQPQHLNINPH